MGNDICQFALCWYLIAVYSCLVLSHWLQTWTMGHHGLCRCAGCTSIKVSAWFTEFTEVKSKINTLSLLWRTLHCDMVWRCMPWLCSVWGKNNEIHVSYSTKQSSVASQSFARQDKCSTALLTVLQGAIFHAMIWCQEWWRTKSNADDCWCQKVPCSVSDLIHRCET
jgi:hypothetical protein